MSHTSKINIASGFAGAGLTTLPQTGDSISNMLPIVGMIMLAIVVLFFPCTIMG